MRKQVSYCIILLTALVLLSVSNSCKKDQLPVIQTAQISDIQGTTATSGGNILSEGSASIISAGVCWSKSSIPTINDNKTSDPVENGLFVSKITGLNSMTKYFVRSYATSSVGTSYGDTLSFKTLGSSPSIRAYEIKGTTNTTARISIKVNPNYLSTTVTVEYGTTTAMGNKVSVDEGPVNSGIDTTLFATLTDLASGTIYHLRIKAENILGTDTGSDFTLGTTITGMTGTISDPEGNTYNTIGIGYQNWMAENLRASKYNDGTPIPNIQDSLAWVNLTSAAYCYYIGDLSNATTFGKLYNWYAVSTENPKKVCPAGWHVPEEVEWNSFFYFLESHGYSSDGLSFGYKIGSSLSATTSWHASTTPGAPGNTDFQSFRNKTGFNATAGGIRSVGTFGYIAGGNGYKGDIEMWWSSSSRNTTESFSPEMDIWWAGVILHTERKVSGLHVRCIQDNWQKLSMGESK